MVHTRSHDVAGLELSRGRGGDLGEIGSGGADRRSIEIEALEHPLLETEALAHALAGLLEAELVLHAGALRGQAERDALLGDGRHAVVGGERDHDAVLAHGAIEE